MKIGVVLPMSENPETGQYPTYATIRQLAVVAEDLGFDSIWLYDHLVYRLGENPKTTGTWEIWTLLSALAEATSRVEMGTIVLSVPFRNPAVLAKMADALDEVSGGRVILGLGAGWHEPEFRAFGIPFDHLASRFEEGARIITSLLRTGHADFQGTYYQANDCVLLPRGPKAADGGMPIMIAARQPRMLESTARYADLWNTAWLGNPTLLAERWDSLKAACERVGRDPNDIAVTVGVTVVFPGLDPDDDTDPATLSPEKFVVGSAEEIADVFTAYADLGVSHLQVACAPMTVEAFERLADAVRVFRAR